MFVQVITGTVTDRDAFERQEARWHREVRPGAVGFLGSTSGVTPDDRFVVVARFESGDAAAANGELPAQQSWWADTEPTVADVTFADSVDVRLPMGVGGSDEAGFVQVMRGRILDAATYEKLDARMTAQQDTMSALRPDVIGGVTVLHGDDTYTDVVYFSSEAEARAGEQQEDPDSMPELVELMELMHAAVTVDEYLDLPDPRLR